MPAGIVQNKNSCFLSLSLSLSFSLHARHIILRQSEVPELTAQHAKAKGFLMGFSSAFEHLADIKMEPGYSIQYRVCI